MLGWEGQRAWRIWVEDIGRGKPSYDGRAVHLGPGDDLYYGDGKSNRIFGEDGDDTIQAQSGDDKVNGGAGDDTLSGGNGNDYLIGGDGDDALIGGKGRDYIFGGLGGDSIDVRQGRDVILYHSSSESLPGGQHDTIRGYGLGGHDAAVDLRHIDADVLTPENDAFTWIGDDAFSGTPGELRFDPKVSVSLLQGDVDGDRVADFEVYFLTFSPLHLTEDQFKL